MVAVSIFAVEIIDCFLGPGAENSRPGWPQLLDAALGFEWIRADRLPAMGGTSGRAPSSGGLGKSGPSGWKKTEGWEAFFTLSCPPVLSR